MQRRKASKTERIKNYKRMINSEPDKSRKGIVFLNQKLYVYLCLSLCTGLGIGILTVFGQTYLPGNFNSIANLGPVWLLPAFFISSTGDKMVKSMLAAFLSLVGMVFGYYIFVAILHQHALAFDFFMLIWTACAVIGGIVIGIAGYLWRHKTHRFHHAGGALLSGAFLVDGINMLIHFNDYTHMIPVPIAEILFGFVLILLLEKNKKDRLKTCKYILPIVAIGLAGYALLFYVTSNPQY